MTNDYNFGQAIVPGLLDIQQLREENARLKKLLDQHGISWETSTVVQPNKTLAPKLVENVSLILTTDEKVALFRRLFRGRTDVYPVRWESAKGTSGYTPACSNEWKQGVCRKPKVKCSDCDQRLLLPLTDQVVFDHLLGKRTIGVYPILSNDHCYFLALDFDDADWREDTKAFVQCSQELEIPVSIEISRSGEGAHAWIFFSEAVPANEARQLGTSLISQTCARTRQLSLASYDRMFPNQDYLPKGGFGNLIALPLQKQRREYGCSVFVDKNLAPYPDQWAYLASVHSMSRNDILHVIQKINADHDPLDVAFKLNEVNEKPWQRVTPTAAVINGPLPESLTMVLANQLFIAKNDLPQALANRVVRLAAFPNPEFYKAQAMRLPVWDKARVIGCAENYSQHIGLPRGCIDAALQLLHGHNIHVEIRDERISGRKINAKFTGKLRKDQKNALRELLKHDVGIFCAPTAFGKTITAAALIARRRVSTLILVHRTELLHQWHERLINFLKITEGGCGVIGGGKKKSSGIVDIAVMQSLSRVENLGEWLDRYGQIIVDECHHVSAFSFEAILKQAKAKYVLGLTATPVRRDGHHPIIFMQCGPVRYTATNAETAPSLLSVFPVLLTTPIIAPESAIQDIFRIITNDKMRNQRIASDVLSAYREGRKILVLTERTEHLSQLVSALGDEVEHGFILHGRLTKTQRTDELTRLNALIDSAPRVIFATGRLIGEGFDHPPLDTLFLAMPISWKGTLQQYAGRLHREHHAKTDVRIYDYVEIEQPQLARMWEKRQRGYRAMGYRIEEHAKTVEPSI